MWQSFDILEMTPTGFFLLSMNNLQILKYHKKRKNVLFQHHAEKHFGNGLTVFVNQVSTQSQSIFFVVLIMQLSVAEENPFLLHRNYLPRISNTHTRKKKKKGGGG